MCLGSCSSFGSFLPVLPGLGLMVLLLAGCAGGSEMGRRTGPGEGEGEGEGQPCQDACRLGEGRCVGSDAMQICEDDAQGCTRWSAPVACAEGASCAEGSCPWPCHDECEPGSLRCYAGGTQSCAAPELAGDCARWGPVVPCPQGESCSLGACESVCTDECNPDARDCEDDGFRVCGEHDADPCRDWGVVEACPAGTSCSSGRCLPDCTDECTAQSRGCTGGGYRTCGSFDGDDCLEWSEVIPCAEGEACSNGVCAVRCTDECAAGERRCAADGAGIVRCGHHDDDECLDWGAAQACPDGQVCSFGECAESCADECVAASSRCGEGGVERCGDFDADGCTEWSEPALCPEGESCSGGFCAPACQHECIGGVAACAGGGVRLCGDFDPDPCADWGPVQPCPPGQSCSAGRCVEDCADECARDARRCALGGFQLCGSYDPDDCLEWSESTSCPAGETCSAGRCAASCSDECAAGAARCMEGGVQRCGSFDPDPCLEWGLAVPCGEGRVCSFGSCVERCADECADGSARCQGEAVSACGSFDADACLEWGEPVPCPAGEQCSGGRCSAACQPECAVNAQRCAANGGLQVCRATDAPGACGRWGAELGGAFVAGASLPCPEGMVCSAGRCQQNCQDECGAGEVRCAQGVAGTQQCGHFDADACREWSETKPCAVGQSCSAGRCQAVCSDECAVDARRCAVGGAAAVESCGEHDGDACREWGPATPCAVGEDCADGACVSCAQRPELEGDGLDNDCDGVTDEAAPGTLPGWCVLQHPRSSASTEGLAGPRLYGRVFAEGRTAAAGAHPSVQAEVGWGPRLTRPDGERSADWSWRSAVHFAACTGCGNNDEYVARLTVIDRGDFAVAYRFSIDGGIGWLYCDGDGATAAGEYDPAQAGSLHVGPGVWWGNLQWPHSTEVVAGQSAGFFYGRVYHVGVTDSPGQGRGLKAQLGLGPDGVDPRDEADSWTWHDAAYNVDTDGVSNDEYRFELVPVRAGSWDVAFRYSLDDGATWVHADIDGSQNGYDPSMAGNLVVR